LNNYFMLIGTEGVYSHTFEHEKRADCPVCGGESLEVSISQDWTVERLIEMLVEKQDMCVLIYLFFVPICSASIQPDQETLVVNSNEEHISPGPTTARGGDSP
jgi:hypothetical protein